MNSHTTLHQQIELIKSGRAELHTQNTVDEAQNFKVQNKLLNFSLLHEEAGWI